MGRIARINPGSREFTGPADILDARARPLQEGDEIILNLPDPIYFRVAQITPVLDPSAPPGLMQVHVAAILTFGSKRGVRNREFILVRTAEEAGAMPITLLDAQPNPGGGEERKD